MGRKGAAAKPAAKKEESSSEESSSRASSAARSSSSEEEEASKKTKQQKPIPKGKKGGKAVQQQQESGAAAAAAAASSTAEATTTTGGNTAAAAAAGQPPKRRPVEVIYCPISGWPAEMCEYTGDFAKCKDWHIANAELLAADKSKLESGDQHELGRKQKVPGAAAELANRKDIVREVSIDVRKRMGRKKLTYIKGLEIFGHQLTGTALAFKKRFSCGCTVLEPPNPGMPGTIEIQGDVGRQLLEILPTQFSVPRESIKTLREGKPADFLVVPSAKKGEESGEDDDGKA